MSASEKSPESSSQESTLSEARKLRKQYEQEAALLANRIKMLQAEEMRTRKQIEDMKKKTDLVIKVQAGKETDKVRLDKVRAARVRAAEEARQRLSALRTQRNAERAKNQTRLWLAKKEACLQIRAEKEEGRAQREQIIKAAQDRNRERCLEQKNETRKTSKRTQREGLTAQRVEIAAQIFEEESEKLAKEREVRRMEQLEIELISKLKYTQMLEQEARRQLQEGSREIE